MNDKHAPTVNEGGADAGGVAGLVERAFQYRGDVTVRTDDGGSVTGYLFNRNARASEPFAQLFETRSGRTVTIPYSNISNVLFTGRDAVAASLKHFEAFQNRREAQARTGQEPSRS